MSLSTHSMTVDERNFRMRIIFSWLFLILVHFWRTQSLPGQLAGAPLVFPESDNSYWVYLLSGWHNLLIHHAWVGMAFDVLVTSSCLICILVPEQRLFTWITVLGSWIIYLAFCTVAGKHYAQIGFLLMPMAFLALQPARFSLTWDLVRYWICILYGTAGLYKIYYGGFAASDNLSPILMQMNADWFHFHPTGVQASVLRYLIDQPDIAQLFYRLTVLVDLLAWVGLFTRKADRWILLGLLSFHLANWGLNHISFVEQSLIFAPFLPWERWGKFIQHEPHHD
jgi:hypothetical protein